MDTMGFDMSIEITERQKNDTLAMTIITIIGVMKTDFAASFTKIYKTDDELINFKRRMYAQALKENINPIELIDAYETLITKNTKFLPSLVEIMAQAKEISKENQKKERNIKEAEELARLPAPTHSVNPLKMLATAKTAANVDNHTDWLEIKALALKNHEAVISIAQAQGKIRKPIYQTQHFCSFPGCDRLGSISGGTSGGGSFYCKTHWVRL
jgi:hypothetical protein